MFVHIRYFAYISTVIVILVAIGLGYYFHSEAAKDLTRIVEHNNISLAQGYQNTTWEKHYKNINTMKILEKNGKMPRDQWHRFQEFSNFIADTFTHFEGVKVARLKIYTETGGAPILTLSQGDQNIINSGRVGADAPQPQSDVLSEDNATREIFGSALAGRPASRIVEDADFLAPSGEKIQGTLIQTFIPIVPDTVSSSVVALKAGEAAAPSDMEAIIEIDYDITPQWSQLTKFQIIVTSGIIFVFVALQGTLLAVAKMAENLISTQHEEKVELAATAAKAEAESRQKSQFLANVSHELRTPLNAIIGFSEIIKNQVMGPLQNEQYMNYINDIHGSGVHLLSLINDILDFSKAEAGKLELQLSELDATKLIKNCMRLVSPRAEQAGVQLLEEVPKEHFVITGDAKKLKQVLLNLLSNSVKFTPQGGNVKVTAWQNVMDDSISIEVKDSGIGISPKDISRAMSPFGQVDSKLSRKYEGTGLGLPLTKKFVEIMGGTFQIESELNVGTTITITIPLTPPRHVMKSASKPSDVPEEKREKQVSPQLMEAAQRAETDPLDGMEQNLAFNHADQIAPIAPVQRPASTPLLAPEMTVSSMLSSQSPQPPSDTPSAGAADKPMLIRPANSAAQPDLHPVRPLTAGTTMAPAAPMVPAAPIVPAEPLVPPAPAPQPSASLIPEQHHAHAPAPAPSPSGGTHSFTSYEDLKKMMAAQSGKK